jgi:UDP-N-acetylenolpyruvoylglucosamine reductase
MAKIENYIDDIKDNITGKVLINEKLARHTTFRIGGTADALIWIEDESDIKFASNYLVKKKSDLK